MVDPIAFTIGSLEIRWYGIIFALGFLIGIYIAAKIAKSKGINPEIIYDLMVYLIPASVIGARLFEVLVYEPSYYFANPSEIIAVWHGGMSIHGGIIGAVIATLIFCKKRNIHFYTLADILAIPLAFGLFLGRIGNFLNQELYGRYTNLPWGITFNGVEGKRHPTQIYSSLKNLIVFFILLKLNKIKDLPRGFLFWSFLLMYSIIRFFIEFLKDTKIIFWNLNLSQLIILPTIILSAIVLYNIYKKNSKSL